MHVDNFEIVVDFLPPSQKGEYAFAEVLYLIQARQKHKHGLFLETVQPLGPHVLLDLVQDQTGRFEQLLVSVGMLVTPNDRSPLLRVLLPDKLIQCVQVEISFFEIRRLVDIDHRAGESRLQELQGHVLVNLPLLFLLLVAVLVVCDETLLLAVLSISGLFLLLELDDLLVEVLLTHEFVDMVRGKVVPEKLVVDRGAHQNNPDLGKVPDHPFEGSEDEVGVDVSFMHFVQYNERVLLQKLGIMDESLQKYAVRHENYAAFLAELCFLADLVTHNSLSSGNLRLNRGLQRCDGQSSGLDADYLCRVVGLLQILVNQPRDLSGLAATSVPCHQNYLITDDLLEDFLLFLKNRQVSEFLV